MRKKILSLLIVMATVFYASAQMTVIPKVGISLAKIATGEDDLDTKSNLGLSLGAAFNFQMNDMISVQPELLFVQRGVKYEVGSSSGSSSESFKFKATMNYIEIPVLVKTTFGADNFKFFLNAGPSLGLGLGGKTKVEASVTNNGVTTSAKEEGKIKFGGNSEDEGEFDVYFDNRMDFGLQLGGGVILANKIMIDLRYGLGLSNLYDKSEGVSAEEAKSKNRVLQFTVGMPLGGK